MTRVTKEGECTTTPILPAIDGYDWQAAFSYACGTCEGSSCNSGTPEWVTGEPNATKPPKPFGREDVETIYGIIDGENDGPEWLVFGKLRDGRYFFLAAGCDYTGWDCQASGRSYVSRSRKRLEAMAITAEEYARMLGIEAAS